ncbi:molecular chaperone GrpE, partial [Phenoliferia sp. Uapishka_3]
MLRSNPLAAIARSARTATLPRSTPSTSFAASRQLHSTRSSLAAKESEKDGAAAAEGESAKAEADPHAELLEQLEQKNKMIAELKDARLRSLADFENLQKISAREKINAKDFALTSFARDLISSIDILSLALKSIPEHKLVHNHADAVAGSTINEDLVSLHQGVRMTKAEIEKVLKRHGVTPFDPVGEQFDPNLHEALYQAPVPGKEPGSVLETQEIGYMIKDRLLRPAKSMHGGLTSSLVDTMGSLALSSKGMWMTGVSTDIHVTFVRAAMVGDEILLKSEVVGQDEIKKILAITRRGKHQFGCRKLRRHWATSTSTWSSKLEFSTRNWSGLPAPLSSTFQVSIMSSHPTSYKAAQVSEKGGAFKIVDIAWKEPEAGQVVVKTLACGVCHSNSLRNMNIKAGEIVAVQGVGGLGHLALQFSKAMGFRTIALSSGDAKKALAKELGASDYLDATKCNQAEELQKLGGAKVIIGVAPSGKSLSALLGGLAVDGQLLVLALAEDMAIPMAALIQKRLSGSPIDSEETVAFAQMAGVACRIEKYTLDQVNEAYKSMMDGYALGASLPELRKLTEFALL